MPTEANLTQSVDRPPAKRLILANWRRYIIYIGFVCIFVVFAVTLKSQGFLNPSNLLNIVRQSAVTPKAW